MYMYSLVLMILSFTLVLSIFTFYFMYMYFVFKSNKYTCIPHESFAFMQFTLWTLLWLGYVCILLVLDKNIHIPRSLFLRWKMNFYDFHDLFDKMIFMFWASLIIFMKNAKHMILVHSTLYLFIHDFVSWLFLSLIDFECQFLCI